MAVVNHMKKWLYLMEPHTASRATSQFLKEKMGASEIGHHHIGVSELTNERRLHIKKKILYEYDILCTIRNPFDTIVTRWLYSGKGGMLSERARKVARERKQTIEEFRASEEVVPLSEWIFTNVDHPTLLDPMRGLYRDATNFIYYEFLNEDLSKTFNRDIQIPRANQTLTKSDWRSYYKSQPELVEFLLSKWGGFLTAFGYEVVNTPDRGIDVIIQSGVRDRLVRRINRP